MIKHVFLATDASAAYIHHAPERLLLRPDYNHVRGSIRSTAEAAFAARNKHFAFRVVPFKLERMP